MLDTLAAAIAAQDAADAEGRSRKARRASAERRQADSRRARSTRTMADRRGERRRRRIAHEARDAAAADAEDAAAETADGPRRSRARDARPRRIDRRPTMPPQADADRDADRAPMPAALPDDERPSVVADPAAAARAGLQRAARGRGCSSSRASSSTTCRGFEPDAAVV
jgi:hypothetical protein